MTEQPNTAAIKALCKAQAEMTGAIKGSENPHFRSKYADLGAVQDACLPSLQKHGFAVTSRLGNDENGGFLETVLIHESGEVYRCSVPLIVDKQNMQGLGSAITYARRYGLMCLSGVAPEDDDGNSAADNPPKNDYTKANQRLAREREESLAPQDDRPPPREEPPSHPSFSPKAIAFVIVQLKAIWDLAELGAYWNALKTEQPGMIHAPGVAEAKDAQKAAIAAKQDKPGDDVGNAPEEFKSSDAVDDEIPY